MSTLMRGKVWKLGDNVNTDVMAPVFAAGWTWDEMNKAVLHVNRRFIEQAVPGDVIVAGNNWGCWSSRENAPANLKRPGIEQ